jgi:tetratricopeptide (TPR) repeat protein
MAEKPVAKSTPPASNQAAKPAEPPKAVHIGGESLLDRIRPHIKQILIGMLALAVVLTAVFTVRWFKERGQVAATERLERVLEVAQEPIRAKEIPADPKRPSFTSTKERAAAVLDEMAKQNTDAAGHAFRAGQLLDVGKIDEAIAEYRAGAGDKTIEGVLCREGLGLALEAKASAEKDAAARQKGFEDALAAFNQMQPEETGPRRAYALYHQGRMQMLLGKRTEAKTLFEKAKQANTSDSDLADLIEKRLAGLGAS